VGSSTNVVGRVPKKHGHARASKVLLFHRSNTLLIIVVSSTASRSTPEDWEVDAHHPILAALEAATPTRLSRRWRPLPGHDAS
jgi:hypothetical protein